MLVPFLELRRTELEIMLQMRPHQGRIEKVHLLQPAVHTPLNASQDTIGLLGHKDIMLAHS